ncbi:MAG: L-threonylcarbamoyladenylate synthase [Candidatus Bathyarchaeota archaeon]|jgi:L-threonylcarbamoyladenylate synthase
MKTLPATDTNIKKAAVIIRNGGTVIYPTETVYGIGCAPQIPEAAKRICYAKGRADKPLPLACSDTETAAQIVAFNPAADRLAGEFWPGPLMLILPAKVEYSIWVTHSASTLGVRVPDHRISRRLARLSGGVIVSTSANLSGEKPATSASEAAEKLGDKVDLILDGGPSQGGVPSTIVDLSGVNPWIIRKGPITVDQIKKALSP